MESLSLSCAGRRSGPRPSPPVRQSLEKDVIVSMANELLDSPEAYAKMAKAVNPYGDGHACARITQAIEWYFGRTAERPANFCTE